MRRYGVRVKHLVKNGGLTAIRAEVQLPSFVYEIIDSYHFSSLAWAAYAAKTIVGKLF